VATIAAMRLGCCLSQWAAVFEKTWLLAINGLIKRESWNEACLKDATVEN